jgi:CheY-like chemotaxis protein
MITRSLTPVVAVKYSMAEDLWLTEINTGEFQDAILNLAINARDAMPGGGELFIETRNINFDAGFSEINYGIETGDYVQLQLTDTGSGMDEETLEHIFEPFFTTKEKGKGTGLGMAMVYGFVRRYKGHIKIDSEPGKGTTMRLYLPRSSALETASHRDSSDDTDLPTGNERILIVDDESDLLQLAGKYLSDLGYSTHLAKNASQALETLEKEGGIHMLFSDVVMPGGINGYELAEQATQQQPELRVLLSSGFTSKSIVSKAHTRFANNLISKPYRKAELARRIRQLLDEKMTS